MGGGSSKQAFRTAVLDLVNSQQVGLGIDMVWGQDCSWVCSNWSKCWLFPVLYDKCAGASVL